jgi:hypothetical protein
MADLLKMRPSCEVDESAMGLPVVVGVRSQLTTEEFQFFCENFLVEDGCSSVYQGGEHRMLTGWVVV